MPPHETSRCLEKTCLDIMDIDAKIVGTVKAGCDL